MQTDTRIRDPQEQHSAVVAAITKLDIAKLPRWLKGTVNVTAALCRVSRKAARRMVLDRYPIIGKRLREAALGKKRQSSTLSMICN